MAFLVRSFSKSKIYILGLANLFHIYYSISGIWLGYDD